MDVALRHGYSFGIWQIGGDRFPEWIDSRVGWTGWRKLPCKGKQLQVPFLWQQHWELPPPLPLLNTTSSPKVCTMWEQGENSPLATSLPAKIPWAYHITKYHSPEHPRDSGYQRWLWWGWGVDGDNGTRYPGFFCSHSFVWTSASRLFVGCLSWQWVLTSNRGCHLSSASTAPTRASSKSWQGASSGLCFTFLHLSHNNKGPAEETSANPLPLPCSFEMHQSRKIVFFSRFWFAPRACPFLSWIRSGGKHNVLCLYRVHTIPIPRCSMENSSTVYCPVDGQREPCSLWDSVTLMFLFHLVLLCHQKSRCAPIGQRSANLITRNKNSWDGSREGEQREARGMQFTAPDSPCWQGALHQSQVNQILFQPLLAPQLFWCHHG